MLHLSFKSFQLWVISEDLVGHLWASFQIDVGFIFMAKANENEPLLI